MKDKKRLVCLALALASVLCLFAGCGGDNAEGKKPANGQQEELPEFVYVPEYVDIQGDFNSSIGQMIYTDGKFFTSYYGVTGNNTPEGVTPEYEGQYDVYGTTMCWIGIDGSVTTIDGYEPMPVPEEGDGSSYIQSVMLNAEGDIVTLESVYSSIYTGPDDIEKYSDEYWNFVESKEAYYLRTLDSTGAELANVCLNDALADFLEDQDYFYPQSFIFGEDGMIYMTMDGGILVMDAKCENVTEITLKDDTWVDSLVKTAAGAVGALYYGEGGYKFAPIDKETKSLGEAVQLPSNAYNAFTGSGVYDFFYNTGSNLCGFNLETLQSDKILNWIDSDLDSDNVGSITVLPDERIASVSCTWDANYENCENQLVLLTKQPSSSVPQKTTITMASLYMSSQVRSQVIQFNKTNDQYRIRVNDYSEYNTEEDYTAGMTKLTTEILGGKVPDLIDSNSMPLSQFAAQGYLEDLYPYLDADTELSRDAILPSVLTAMESDGKLYSTCSDFYIMTVIGASSVVGDKPGWTLADLKAAYATMPEGCEVFDVGYTKSDVMNYCYALEANKLVNWATGECNFEGQEFKDILDFVSMFPTEFDYENYEWSEDDSTQNKIMSGRQMLMMTSISDFNNFQMYKAMFGGDITFIGLPTSDGVGNMLITRAGFAMSSKSEYKDACWQFLRQFFTESYQEKNSWSFPTNKAAFDAKLEKAMTPVYQKNENGEYILDENGNKIEESQGGYGFGDTVVEIYALTQDEADLIMELVNTTTRAFNTDQSILDIINEQCALYFEGQKTAEEAAKLVQSKANIYVNEQR